MRFDKTTRYHWRSFLKYVEVELSGMTDTSKSLTMGFDWMFNGKVRVKFNECEIPKVCSLSFPTVFKDTQAVIE